MSNSSESVGVKPSACRAASRRDVVSAIVLAAPILMFVGLVACNVSKSRVHPQLGAVGAMTDNAGAVGGATTTINTAFAFTAPY